MALIDAAANGNVQACWMMPCFSVFYIRPNPSMSTISFHQAQPTNITRLTLPRPASNSHKQKSSARRLISASSGMPCPNFVSLMCVHASTQLVQVLLDKGVGPDDADQIDAVSICAAKGSVSVHIRLVYIAALFPLASGCVVCSAGARCAGSGVTSHTPCTRNHTVTHL